MRELDAEVAEKVMGLSIIRGWTSGHLTNIWKGEDPEDYDAEPVPHYSSDIAAAWQVVERMRDLGWRYMVEQTFHLVDRQEIADHHAMFLQRGAISSSAYAYGATAPEAICKAALAALTSQ